MSKLTTVLDVAFLGSSCDIWKTPRFIEYRFHVKTFSDSATKIVAVFNSLCCKNWVDIRYIRPCLTFLVIPRNLFFPKISESTLWTLAFNAWNSTMIPVQPGHNLISLRIIMHWRLTKYVCICAQSMFLFLNENSRKISHRSIMTSSTVAHPSRSTLASIKIWFLPLGRITNQ